VNTKTKQWKGRIKQAAGTVTGNKKLEREGRADRLSGEAKERVTQAKNKADELIDKVTDTVKHAIGTRKGRSPHR
jgi:uncharacterized protein YjbJ (UPF0337 family)